MKNYPRKHHFIPKFYLKGFTDTGNEAGKFWIFDLESCTKRSGKPINEAHERDFYMVESLDQKDIVESLLNKIESEAAPIIKQVIKDIKLPTGDNFYILVTFVALLLLRTPSFRQEIARYNELVSKKYLKSVVDNPEIFEITKYHVYKKQPNKLNTISYDQMKQFIEKNNFKIQTGKNKLIRDFLKMLEPFFQDLSTLYWSLVVTNDETSHFICSDNPVSIFPTVRIPLYQSHNWLDSHPQIMMPLNNNFALFISDVRLPSILYADSLKVSNFNTNTADIAIRYIYSSKDDFSWLCDDGKIGNACYYLQKRPYRTIKSDEVSL